MLIGKIINKDLIKFTIFTKDIHKTIEVNTPNIETGASKYSHTPHQYHYFYDTSYLFLAWSRP